MTKEIQFPGLTEYLTPYHPYFYCINSRETAECYLAGLMMDGERKSVEPMSERVNASERVMQYFLSSALWDEQKVAAEYRRRMLMETSDPQGLLVIDDTGFPKKVVIVRVLVGNIVVHQEKRITVRSEQV